MTRLSDTQLVILTAAAQRADLSVLPLPETLKLKGGALTKVMDSLRNKGLIRVIETDGRPQRVVLTSEGMAAIGVEREDEGQTTAPVDADTAATAADAATAVGAPTPAAEADNAAKPAKRRAMAKAKAAKPGKAAPAEKPTPRAGTKQAQMIEMLKRPEGATVEQIAAATGWQHHTIRGAISGALKKKLGLTIETTRTREVGPNKTGPRAAPPSTGSPAHRRWPAEWGSANMHGLLKQPGYRLYAPGSSEARALLAEQGLGPADLDRALAHLERVEGTTVGAIVGINEDGVFGTGREGWRPDLSGACREPFIPLLWLKVHELLGRLPQGSTARFIANGALPD
jgi:hypothetical protein